MTVKHKEDESRVILRKDIPELELLNQQIQKSSYRTSYHIQPITGLLNDPNGFSYYNGKWHIFYQWYPFDAVHGMKHWYHVQSEDLVHFENAGLALYPDTQFDNHGCYSGSGMVIGDMLYLAYTGNNHDGYGRRHPYQMLAQMNADGHFGKLNRPIIREEKNYTEHQRDPKIFKHGDMYYILLGAQNHQKQGVFLLYRSKNLLTDWTLCGELKIDGYDHFGYMVECPDIERIGEDDVLIFSPQGMDVQDKKAQNKFQSVYLIGTLDLENMVFHPKTPLRQLDHGFDFYAPQCAYQNVFLNQAVLCGWFGVSDYTYPITDQQHWAGLLTLPRILSIENGQLKQRPMEKLQDLVTTKILEVKNSQILFDQMHGRMQSSCLIDVSTNDDTVFLDLFSAYMHAGFVIDYQPKTKTLTIDKSDMEQASNIEFGTKRIVHLEHGLHQMQIFVDHSAIEIFVNDGEYVLSSRVFPTLSEHLLRMGGNNISIVAHQMETGCDNAFVIVKDDVDHD